MDQVLFGERLKNAREAAGMSRKHMAGRIGVKLGTVESWESGTLAPRANRLSMLANMLNVPLLWLLAGSQHPPDPTAGVSQRELLLNRIDELGRQVEDLGSAVADLRTLAESGD